MRERLTIVGPVGDLEAVLEQPDPPGTPVTCVAVICHPHPLYGGNMDNKVVTTLARCAVESGMAALRFNFRGVGASQGSFDNAEGEIEDALAALDWMMSKFGTANFMLMGFSFGGLVAARAATRRKPIQLVTVAPALHYLAGEPTPVPGCHWLLLHGRDDDVVACNDTVARVQSLQPPVDVRLLDEVGHFFHGRLGDLRDIVTPVLHSRLTELAAR